MKNFFYTRFEYRNIVWICLTIIATLVYALSPATLQCPTIDSAIFLTCAEWMRDGLSMYRDIFDHKGPLIYLFDILGLYGGLTGVWLLCILWIVISANFVYLICKIYASPKASFIASIFFLLLMTVSGNSDNTVELVAMPFVCCGMYVLLKPLHLQKQIFASAIFIASLCIAFIFLLKPNLAAGIVFLAVVILYKLVRTFSTKVFLCYLLCFLSAFLIVAYPLYIILVQNNSWDDYLTTFWLFNMRYSSVLSFKDKLINGGQLLFIYIPSFISWLFVLRTLSIGMKCEYKKEIFSLLGMLLFTGYITCGLSGFRFGHYLLPVFPIFCIFISIAFDKENKRLYRNLYCLISFFLGCYFAYKQYGTYKSNISTERTDLIYIADYIQSNTEPKDKIVLYGIDPSVYLLSERKSVTRYIYQQPIFSIQKNMQKEFIEEIRKGKPRLIVIKNDLKSNIPLNIISDYEKIKSHKETSIYEQKNMH